MPAITICAFLADLRRHDGKGDDDLPVLSVGGGLTLFLQIYGRCSLHDSDSYLSLELRTPQSDSVIREEDGIPVKHDNTSK